MARLNIDKETKMNSKKNMVVAREGSEEKPAPKRRDKKARKKKKSCFYKPAKFGCPFDILKCKKRIAKPATSPTR